jgi:hypothetical protein
VLVLTPLASSLVCVFLMYIGSPLVIAWEGAWWCTYLESL